MAKRNMQPHEQAASYISNWEMKTLIKMIAFKFNINTGILLYLTTTGYALVYSDICRQHKSNGSISSFLIWNMLLHVEGIRLKFHCKGKRIRKEMKGLEGRLRKCMSHQIHSEVGNDRQWWAFWYAYFQNPWHWFLQ